MTRRLLGSVVVGLAVAALAAAPASAQPERGGGAEDEGTPWVLIAGVTLGVSGALGILLGVVLARRDRVREPRLASSSSLGAAGLRRVRSFVSGAETAPAEAPAEEPDVAEAPAPPEAEEQPTPPEAPPSGPPSGATPAKREAPRKAKPPAKGKASKKRKHAAGGRPPRKGAPRATAPSEEAVPQAGREEAAAPAPPPPPAPPETVYVEVAWEECQIEYWPTRSASGALSDFYALAVRPGGETYIAAVSQPFRWGRGEPPGAVGEKADAHAALVDLLLGEGWQPAGSGAEWYQTRFRRPLLAPEPGTTG